jgi:hypothetical protein
MMMMMMMKNLIIYIYIESKLRYIHIGFDAAAEEKGSKINHVHS